MLNLRPRHHAAQNVRFFKDKVAAPLNAADIRSEMAALKLRHVFDPHSESEEDEERAAGHEEEEGEEEPVFEHVAPVLTDRDQFPSLTSQRESNWDVVSETSAAGSDWDMVSEASADEYSDLEEEAGPMGFAPLQVDYKRAAERGLDREMHRLAARAASAVVSGATNWVEVVPEEEESESESDESEESEEEEPEAEAAGGWTCTHCTFRNPAAQGRACGVCEAPFAEPWRETPASRAVSMATAKLLLAARLAELRAPDSVGPAGEADDDEAMATFFSALRRVETPAKSAIPVKPRQPARPKADELTGPEPEVVPADVDEDTLLDLFFTFKAELAAQRRTVRRMKKGGRRR